MSVKLKAVAAGAIITVLSGAEYTADANAIFHNVSEADVLSMLGAGATPLTNNVRQNLAATTDPTVNDDSAHDYGVGSMWVNTTGGSVFICEDATATAAVWVRTGGSKIPVAITGNVTLTAAANGNRLNLVDAAAGATLTLPAATGTGNEYPIALKTTVTSNNVIVQVANGTDIIQGSANQTGATGAATNFVAGAADDTITLNGSTKGGFKGDALTLVDAAAGLFILKSLVTKITGSAATPFSSAV